MKKLLLKISGIGFLIAIFYKIAKTIGENNIKLGLSAQSLKDMLEANRNKENTNEEVNDMSDSDLDDRL